MVCVTVACLNQYYTLEWAELRVVDPPTPKGNIQLQLSQTGWVGAGTSHCEGYWLINTSIRVQNVCIVSRRQKYVVHESQSPASLAYSSPEQRSRLETNILFHNPIAIQKPYLAFLSILNLSIQLETH